MKSIKSEIGPFIRDTFLYLGIWGVPIFIVPILIFSAGYSGNAFDLIFALAFICIPFVYVFRPRRFRKTKRSKAAFMLSVALVGGSLAAHLLGGNHEGRVLIDIMNNSEVRINSIRFIHRGIEVLVRDPEILRQLEDKLNNERPICIYSGSREWNNSGRADVQFANPNFTYHSAETKLNRQKKILRIGFYIKEIDDEYPVGYDISYANTMNAELLRFLEPVE